MANKKMTKRDYFSILRDSYPATAENYDEVIAFIDHEVELLAKKNAADRKPTAKQIENRSIADTIVENMEVGKLYTISELMKLVDVPDFTNQRCSAIMRSEIGNRITRSEDKRKAYFSRME